MRLPECRKPESSPRGSCYGSRAGLPPHRQQPADAEVSIGYNCMSADDLEAARTAFEGKGLVVPPGGSVKEEDLCDLYFGGSDSIDWHELRLEGIRMKQESERVR